MTGTDDCASFDDFIRYHCPEIYSPRPFPIIRPGKWYGGEDRQNGTISCRLWENADGGRGLLFARKVWGERPLEWLEHDWRGKHRDSTLPRPSAAQIAARKAEADERERCRREHLREFRLMVKREAEKIRPLLKPASPQNAHLLAHKLGDYADYFCENPRGNLMIERRWRGVLWDYQEILAPEWKPNDKLPFAYAYDARGKPVRGKLEHGLAVKGAGRAVRDTYCVYGDERPQAVGEGAATCFTFWLISGLTCLCAFDSGNMERASIEFPGGLQSVRWIAADNDNAGRRAAAAWVKHYPSARVILPPDDGDDWNDCYCRYGLAKAREIVSEAMERADA